MGIIAKRGKAKSDRMEWFHFIDGAEFLLRYVNPQEREKLIEAANERKFDLQQGRTQERINTKKLAAEMRKIGVIQDWKIDAAVLPQIIDQSEYSAPGTLMPFDEEDCEYLIANSEGLGVWLLDNIRAIGAFTAAEALKRKNALSPSPGDTSRLSTTAGASPPAPNVSEPPSRPPSDFASPATDAQA